MNWKPNEFKIAINMAGAVSAGAYTAGVLDFLIEALEEWQKAKDAFRSYLANPAPNAAFPNPVPLHDVIIEAFSGASAGGMCAAIAAVMVQSQFTHIVTAKEQATNNTFYESWVNDIDIIKLLAQNDLVDGEPLASILDSSIIDVIAAKALVPGVPQARPYISDTLTLFLSLTNARGIQYPLYGSPSPMVNEYSSYYGDRIRFECTTAGQTSTPTAKALPKGQPGAGAWQLLQEAAKATGAFPLFLAPRRLSRDLDDYDVPPWQPVVAPKPNPPIPSDVPGPPPTIFETLNIDGGVTDNDPFELSHDYLASQNPRATPLANSNSNDGHNPRDPDDANCAVISVAPFPSVERYSPTYDFKAASAVLPMLGRLFTIMLSQSRFEGESLAAIMRGPVFSRFVIAPSDPALQGGDALQCGKLGAFGGFMERSFRAHDFLLGRYNCQRFLSTHFCLLPTNPIVTAGQQEAGAYAAQIQAKFGVSRPPGVAVGSNSQWMPVIPLVGSAFPASQQEPPPSPGIITDQRINDISDAVLARIDAIKGPLFDDAPAGGLLKALVGIACTWPFRLKLKSVIVDQLTSTLGPVAKASTT